MDTQRALYAAQDQLVQSEQAVAANLIALYKALGGGWDLMPLAQARRYEAVDPDNRLVAAELEARWNARSNGSPGWKRD